MNDGKVYDVFPELTCCDVHIVNIQKIQQF